VNIAVVDELKDWETKDGVAFLRTIGVKDGDKVLDFGCGPGHYSIPAAITVGKTGTVYAVDKEPHSLNELRKKVERLGLKNVITIKTSGGMDFASVGGSINVIILYDVLHYFQRIERAHLYSQCFRILNDRGFLSVYPKHTTEDLPSRYFQECCVNDIICEISELGFQLTKKHCSVLSHNNNLGRGCVYNFKKIKI
jgi:ubiquinone/menaquinone biosynthesis C-methylase UbiE